MREGDERDRLVVHEGHDREMQAQGRSTTAIRRLARNQRPDADDEQLDHDGHDGGNEVELPRQIRARPSPESGDTRNEARDSSC